ncbi:MULTISPECIES: SGNH/GDSL hydrolase family protein [Zoogloea]|jgi:outer membrane lipase/esterase|uniref:PEP-CTERM sorting domain-containing protein n=1 Tax=Zoogloea oleivorans TaxID=1552750 RepID=A0A6C2D7B4_9RHOO|nr:MULTISPECIES: SGNH/GDSL hydrolase family protein [Zoogloea]MDD2668592.1 SGNH/GDSL hydrolase family protein [Zoogloea sp.]MDY0035209.1 SGNH/GDSL hydrolase family protein [Zoogloea oleivorans]TYC61489.1 hypothetical protein ETQ85_02135 [Zoogloea oleivorans]
MEIEFGPYLRRLTLAATLILPSLASASYSQIYVLGDSLSDTGNIAAAYAPIVAANGGVPLPILGLSTEAYAPGRASNGLLWIDLLTSHFGFSATSSLNGGTNYAYGGARTDNQVFNPIIPEFKGLLQQRDALLTDHPVLDPDALYIVWGGANNLQDILTGRPRADGTAQTIGKTVGDLQNIIDSLAAAGAQHFYVPNSPDIGLVPRITERGAGAVAAATFLSRSLNTALAGMLDAQEASGLDIMTFDAFTYLRDVVANPAQYGLDNVTARCYLGDDLQFKSSGSVCATPDDYLFWDGIHPSAAGQQLLASAMINSIPEPATLALGLLGLFGMLGRRTTLALRNAFGTSRHDDFARIADSPIHPT